MSNLITDIETNLNEDFIKKIESFIKCPRCKQNITCLRRKVLTTNKNKYKGVCDHCINEYLLHKTSKSRTDKKLSGKESSSKKYNKEKVKLWLSKVIDLLENNMILLKAANLSKQARHKLMMSTERSFPTYEKSNRVPYETKVDQMFQSLENEVEYETPKPSNVKARKRGISYDEDIKYNVKKIFDDTKERLYYDNSAYNSGSVSQQTIPSVDSHQIGSASLHHKLHILKHDILDDKKIALQELKHYSNLYEKIHTDVTKPVGKNENRELKSGLDIIDTKNDEQANDMKTKHASSTLRKSYSAEPLQSSITDLKDKIDEHNFSYFFPKEERQKKTIRRHKSSSEIIKEVIDMLSTRAELEKINKERLRKKKKEEEQHETKNLVLTQVDDDKKQIASQPHTAKGEKSDKIYKKRIINIEEKSSAKTKSTKSDVKTHSTKSDIKTQSTKSDVKTHSTKSDIKTHSTKSEKDSMKSPKKDIAPSTDKQRKDKDDKAERMRLEKDKKIKEKVEKEQLAKLDKQKKEKEKEERSKLDKEIKMKEKAEKEEHLKVDQDKKSKEKDEKERIKKEKQEQTVKEKEEHAKQKEEKATKPAVKDKTDLKLPAIDTDKLFAQQAKAREEQLKLKKQQEEEEKRMRQLAEQKLKDSENAKEDKPKKSEEIEKPKSPPTETPPNKTAQEKPKIKELDVSKVKSRKPAHDDLIIRLVRKKQAEKRRKKPMCMSDLDITRGCVKAHKGHKFKHLKSCKICQDSDLQLDIDNVIYNEGGNIMEDNNIIIGEKIFKNRLPCNEKAKPDNAFEPILFKSQFREDSSLNVIEKDQRINVPIKQQPEQDVSKGVIRYALSDRSFIEKGWTMLPTEKVVRKMNVYRMRPAHPEFDWFEHNKNKKIMEYESGEKLAEFDDTGKGRWFYRNGRKALDYYDAEEINAQQRIVVYSNGEPDERGRGRPYTILATFDYLGNGIVFDHSGKLRLKYNQTEGVVLDRNIGPVSHWKWHTLNDPPVLQQVMIDTQMAHKDPDILKLGGPADDKTRTDNEEMLAIEFDNFIKEKSKKLSQKFKPFQIKMKALKINENFSLKVLDQATVYLIFRDGSTNLKLNIGMVLDHKEIVDTDTAELGVVSNSLERFPARTDSLAVLQQGVARSQRIEKARVERDRRIRPTQSCASVDKLNAAASKPLRHPFRTVPSDTTTITCRCRKPSSKYIYYDTRLI